VPHALDLPAGGTARCLKIFQPAGFDTFLAELAALSEAQMADETLMHVLNDKYDIIMAAAIFSSERSKNAAPNAQSDCGS
jgi:hypothetical protein